MYSSVTRSTSTLSCNHPPPELFVFPNYNSVHIKHQLCTTSPSPWQPPSYFLFLWIQLLQGPHMSGLIQSEPFCDWLTSFSIMSSRFILLEHVSECVFPNNFIYLIIFGQCHATCGMFSPTRDRTHAPCAES